MISGGRKPILEILFFKQVVFICQQLSRAVGCGRTGCQKEVHRYHFYVPEDSAVVFKNDWLLGRGSEIKLESCNEITRKRTGKKASQSILTFPSHSAFYPSFSSISIDFRPNICFFIKMSLGNKLITQVSKRLFTFYY